MSKINTNKKSQKKPINKGKIAKILRFAEMKQIV